MSVQEKRLTKKEQLEKWVNQAVFYTKKERSTRVIPKPGEIYTADLGVNVGSEINGIRPFLVLSSTNFNDNSGTVTGIPCSLKEFAHPGQILISEDILSDGKVRGIIKVEMLTTISKGRLGTYVGRLNQKGVRQVGKRLEEFLVPLKKLKKTKK